MADRHGERGGLRVLQVERALGDVAPAEFEQLAAAAAGDRQLADSCDGVEPAGFVSVKRAPEPRQFVRVEILNELLPRLLRNTWTQTRAAFAPSPFLGPEHHRALGPSRAARW